MIKKVKEPEKEDLIKNLTYDLTVNFTEKENNLKFLKITLKNYLSINISNKLKTYSKDSNKKFIDIILKEENDIILKFVLNDLIVNLFIRVDNYILDNYYSFENNYFSSFIILLYNLEKWYYIKERRKKRRWNKNK